MRGPEFWSSEVLEFLGVPKLLSSEVLEFLGGGGSQSSGVLKFLSSWGGGAHVAMHCGIGTPLVTDKLT